MEIEKIMKEKQKEKYLIQRERKQFLIDEFKKRKEIEKQNELMEQEKANQVYYNNLDIERIREREEALLQKKKNNLKEKESKKLKNNYEDPFLKYKLLAGTKIRKDNKINEATQSYKNRQRTKFDPKKDEAKDACTMANNLLHLGGRAIPNWRKGL